MPAGPGDEQALGTAEEEQQQEQQRGPAEAKQIGRATDMVSASFGDLVVSKMDNQDHAKKRVGAV